MYVVLSTGFVAITDIVEPRESEAPKRGSQKSDNEETNQCGKGQANIKGGRDSTRGPSVPNQRSDIEAPIAIERAYGEDMDIPLRGLRME